MKNVYFACSIRGGGDTSSYHDIIANIKQTGGHVLSEIFVNDAISLQGSPLPDKEIYQRDTGWIQQADVVIAEVTNPSLGVGYELAYAETRGIPILCLFNKDSDKKLSAMISGNDNLQVVYYSRRDSNMAAIETFLTSH